MDSWTEGNVTPSSHDIEIAAAAPGPKLEAVSSRLKQALMHPNKTSVLMNIRYSPDGKGIIAQDYPGGVIQVWNAETGDQLIKIETTTPGRRSGWGHHLSPDWKTVYVSRERSSTTFVQKDEKLLFRWGQDADVRAWDLSTGELRETFKPQPPRDISLMTLSPDGTTFMTGEQISPNSTQLSNWTASLWDVKTKQSRSLGEGLSSVGAFSPDGKTIAVEAYGPDLSPIGVKLVDVATGKEKITLLIHEKFARINGYTAFTPDGRFFIGQVQIRQGKNNWKGWEQSLRFWDVASSKEVASIPAEAKETGFGRPVFSPDGKTIAIVSWHDEEKGWLFFIDIATKRIVKSTMLGEKAIVGEPAFSPDGKWIAVAAQVIPEEFLRGGREPTAEEVAQPRIHLVDAISGEVRETIIAPQGFTRSVCFSPDGKTLAAGGNGRVLLWDLTKPLGIVETRSE